MLKTVEIAFGVAITDAAACSEIYWIADVLHKKKD